LNAVETVVSRQVIIWNS